jgi:quercetin dioxygenase-like cupin family protein/hemerythrin-like domain-containing protein
MKTHRFAQVASFMIPVLDNGVAKVVHLSFPAGKILDRHKAPSAILVFVMQGKMVFRTDSESVTLQSGDMVSLEKNVEHVLEALEDSVAALVLTPSPNAAVSPGASPANAGHPVEWIPIPPQGAVSPQLQSFVEEHRELLDILEYAVASGNLEAYRKALTAIGEELDQHFRYEEEILFPILGKYIGTSTGPIAVMLAEHKIIRDNYESFQRVFLSATSITDDVRQAFETVAGILRSHIMKEDNVLFPMASARMSEADQNEVARRVAAEKEKREGRGSLGT